MKLGRMAVTAVLAVVLTAGAALAQGPHRGGDMFGPMMGMMTDVLDLTDAQQAQIKQIFDSATPSMEPLRQQEHESHKAMMQLITSGTFDQAKAQSIASQESQIHQELELQHAQLAAQAYQVLTPEQKAKLNDVLAKREQRMQKHMEEHSQPAPQQ